MFWQITRIVLTLATLLLAVCFMLGIAFSSQIDYLSGSIFLALTLLLWVPWRGLFLTWVYFQHRKEAGLGKRLTFLAEFLPALMFYSHYRPAHHDHPQNKDESLLLVTLNAYEPNKKIAPKAEFLIDLEADFVTVSEVNDKWELILANLKHTYPYQKLTRAQDSTKNYHMLLLSKFPAKVIKKRASGRIVHYEIQTPQGPVYLVQLHPCAPFTPRRTLKRDQSIKALGAIKTSLPLIIMGDFNCVPWHKEVRRVLAAQELTLAGLPEPTYPSLQKVNSRRSVNLKPFAPLDYILIPQEAKLLNQQTHRVPETDHLAVSATITLKDAEN